MVNGSSCSDILKTRVILSVENLGISYGKANLEGNFLEIIPLTGHLARS